MCKPVKETCKTVHSIPKETCQKVRRFDEPYKTACFWRVNETSKDGHVHDLGLLRTFVEYFHVFPTSYLRRWKGPAVPERDLQNMDGEKIDRRPFFQTAMTHMINFFASFPVVKQEHVEGNTGCIGFPHLFIGFLSVMVVLANFWTRWWLRFAHGIGHTE